MKQVFHVGIVMRAMCISWAGVVLVFFGVNLVRRLGAGPMGIGLEIFAIAVIVLFTVMPVWLSLYTIEIQRTEVLVRIGFPSMHIRFDQIRSFDLIVPILPFYNFTIDTDVPGKTTTRTVAAVHDQVRFMALLKERNEFIRFSKWNERRIARYLQRKAEH